MSGAELSCYEYHYHCGFVRSFVITSQSRDRSHVCEHDNLTKTHMNDQSGM